MSFTSTFFLTGLLPGLILLFYIFRKDAAVRRVLLFIANMLLYLDGGGARALLLLLAMGVLTWLFCRMCARYHNRVLLLIGCVVLLVPLFLFKYTDIVSGLFMSAGISFFTFEAVSCLCDVYRGEVEDIPSLAEILTYLSFFPTVVSGPVVRIKQFREGMGKKLSLPDFQEGAALFVTGLGKKVLLADKLAPLANYYFDGVAAGSQFSLPGLWFGSFAYTLQLYFDFSGYSDMAIGIGRTLGYHIPSNFNKPYRAESIQDFWRRWHISLSTWFRDYVYIPLGGSRRGAVRQAGNLLVVWVLTGIWHGADSTFLVWGIGYFLLLIMEKYVPQMRRMNGRWYGHLYVLFCVNLLWVPFRAQDCAAFVRYLKGMFGISFGGVMLEQRGIRFLPFLIFCALLCTPWKKVVEKYRELWWFRVMRGLLMGATAYLAVCAVINSSYAPYIYGDF